MVASIDSLGTDKQVQAYLLNHMLSLGRTAGVSPVAVGSSTAVSALFKPGGCNQMMFVMC